jgi:hypothetical protein
VGKNGNACRVRLENLKERPLGRGRRGCENNIKMGDTEIGRDGMD